MKLSLNKFYGRYRDIIRQYEVPLSRMLNDNSEVSSCSIMTPFADQPFNHAITLLPT